MLCFFCGGPLDGELREVSDSLCRTQPLHGYEPRAMTITTLTIVPREYADYHIANGIARHESVSEEEVARLIAGWHAAARTVVEESTERLMSHGRIKLPISESTDDATEAELP